MAEIANFNVTLDALLNSNPHARSKGNAFKSWCKMNFSLDARISHIREQRQTTNRVSEQFRYFDPVVVFVCDSVVKREELIRYIFERTYRQMQVVAIIGVTTETDGNKNKYNYSYEHLFVFKKNDFSTWLEPFFDKTYDSNAIKDLKGDMSNENADFVQIIYFGNPGSGKSHKVVIQIGDTPYRTIFHPDTDYASFVGSYKPVGDEVEGIGYKFIPQVFTNAYVDAWKNPDDQINLVIEEINRGNCAQIFGDLFQLLDRKNGFSEYPVTPNTDLKKHLAKEFAFDEDKFVSRGYNDEIEKNVLKGEVMVLPSNLSIYATMNTSDQSLFPMDSAFKRRWDWEYVPVCYTEETEEGEYNEAIDYTINISTDYAPKWLDFLKGVNEKIKELTFSEDKQMGNYFIKESVNAKTFVNKVMYYIWSEICKEEYMTEKNFFRYEDENNEVVEFSFNDLFPLNDNSKAILKSFIERMIEIGKKKK